MWQDNTKVRRHIICAVESTHCREQCIVAVPLASMHPIHFRLVHSLLLDGSLLLHIISFAVIDFTILICTVAVHVDFMHKVFVWLLLFFLYKFASSSSSSFLSLLLTRSIKIIECNSTTKYRRQNKMYDYLHAEVILCWSKNISKRKTIIKFFIGNGLTFPINFGRCIA